MLLSRDTGPNLLLIWPEGHQKSRNEAEFLSPVKRTVGLNQDASDSECNALTHCTTLPKI